MSEIHTIIIQSPGGLSNILAVEVLSVAPWKLIASGMGFCNREFVGENLFDAFVALRNELENAGHRFLCAGARLDTFPSGMSRSMGGGRKVYITRFGEPATVMIDMFEEAVPESIGTVEQQKEFHTKWIHSLAKLK